VFIKAYLKKMTYTTQAVIFALHQALTTLFSATDIRINCLLMLMAIENEKFLVAPRLGS
jgi:hypothetical protein